MSDSAAETYWARNGRHDQNDASRTHAERNLAPWLDHEHEILLLWDFTEENLDEIAELLERTREACRQRYYKVSPYRRVVKTRRTTTTTTTTTTEASYANWSDEDLAEWGLTREDKS